MIRVFFLSSVCLYLYLLASQTQTYVFLRVVDCLGEDELALVLGEILPAPPAQNWFELYGLVFGVVVSLVVVTLKVIDFVPEDRKFSRGTRIGTRDLGDVADISEHLVGSWRDGNDEEFDVEDATTALGGDDTAFSRDELSRLLVSLQDMELCKLCENVGDFNIIVHRRGYNHYYSQSFLQPNSKLAEEVIRWENSSILNVCVPISP